MLLERWLDVGNDDDLNRSSFWSCLECSDCSHSCSERAVSLSLFLSLC